MSVLLLVAALLAQDEVIVQAKKTFTSRCASCHFVPDTSLRTDRAWLDMVKTTA